MILLCALKDFRIFPVSASIRREDLKGNSLLVFFFVLASVKEVIINKRNRIYMAYGNLEIILCEIPALALSTILIAICKKRKAIKLSLNTLYIT